MTFGGVMDELIAVLVRRFESILKNMIRSVTMITTTKNTDVESKNQPVFLFPSLKYLAPLSKNKATKSTSIISDAMLDCSEFEDEPYMSTQVAGNRARLQITIVTSLKYLELIILVNFVE